MKNKRRWLNASLITLIASLLAIGMGIYTRDAISAANGPYKILAWNDLGMHCYNRDFADLAVLPPYNTLWVQVVKQGNPPTLVTSGITVEYSYADNTYSAGKTNFWDYDKALFGVDLPPNVGLKGKGLSGTLDLDGDHFVAEGIPVTEFSDSAPNVSQPYQLATVVVKDSTSGAVLTSTQVVTPVSSEMRCDTCHNDTGIAKPAKPTGKVETNILQLHDEAEGTNLMANRPVLCAECHGSNALGMAGQPGLKNLSNIMHEKHTPYIQNTLTGCYNCHPGPQTGCLRDVMSTDEGMDCVDCHGGMKKVSTNPNPWLNEPRCDTCHDSGRFDQDHPLFRFSKGHGGLYCEACHDSTHAIAPSREPNDAIKFIALQGRNGPVRTCSVCHTNQPDSSQGPHARNVVALPQVSSITRTDASPSGALSVHFAVTFSKAVAGVDVNDFALTVTGVTGASVASVSGSGSAYSVTVNTGTGDGTIRLDVANNGSIVDLNGNPLAGSYTNGEVYTITKTTGVEVYIGGTLAGNYLIPGGAFVANRYGINSGPVRVFNNSSVPILASQRAIYKNSFNSIVGYPSNQLTTEYWFTSLDDLGMATYLVIGNPSTTQTAQVDVYIGGAKMNATPYSIGPGQRVYPRYGINGGPVRVVSTNGVPIFTSERAKYMDSFNEIMGYPATRLTTEYWFTSLDDLGMITYMVIGNPSTTQTAQVDVYIGGTKMNAAPYSIGPGQRVYPRYGINGGPVRVVSTNGVPIFTSERVKYMDSFNEIMGYPATQLATEYWFTTLDDLGMTTYLVIGNPSTTQTAQVDVYIGGAKMNATPYSIGPGQRVYPRYGINNGPVRVVSTNGVPIFTSERAKYMNSFNEIMGYPATQFASEYWFTSLDDLGMSTSLVIAAP